MNAPLRRNACPSLAEPMQTGDGLLVRLSPERGAFSPRELAALATSAARNGNGIIEVTARGNVQLRGLDHGSVGRLAQDLDDAGIAVRSGVPIDTGPLAGLDADEVADPRPLVAAIRDGIAAHGLGDKLGPKVAVVVDGGGAWPLAKIAGDVRCTALDTGEGLMWAVSCAGDARTAIPVAFCNEQDASAKTLDVLLAISRLGKTARARDLLDPTGIDQRGRSLKGDTPTPDPSPQGRGGLFCNPVALKRPAFPVPPPPCGEGFGVGVHPKSLQAIASEQRLPPLRPSGPPLPPPEGEEGSTASRPAFPLPRRSGERWHAKRDGVGVDQPAKVAVDHLTAPAGPPLGLLPLRDGANALAIALPYGSMTATALEDFVTEAERAGVSEIRPGPGRAFILLGLDATAYALLSHHADRLGFVTDRTDPRITMSVCTGSPACRSGQIDTRALAAEITRDSATWLSDGLPLHISGCAKGCAHPATAPLTLVGGEKGVGIVVNGTAGAQPLAYSRLDHAASGLARLAGLAHRERETGESIGATLSRIEPHRLVAAFRVE